MTKEYTSKHIKEDRLEELMLWLDEGLDNEIIIQRCSSWSVTDRHIYTYINEARNRRSAIQAEWVLKNYSEVQKSILSKLNDLYERRDATIRDKLDILKEMNKVAQGGETDMANPGGFVRSGKSTASLTAIAGGKADVAGRGETDRV